MKWANEWHVNFNIPKCNILQVTTHHTTSKFTHQMNPLRSVEKVYYLEVYLNNKLSWNDHIDYIYIYATKQIDYSVF